MRNPHSSQIVAVPNRMLLPAFFSDSGGPDRVLDLSLVVFDDGAVFCSPLVVSKSYRFEEDTFRPRSLQIAEVQINVIR